MSDSYLEFLRSKIPQAEAGGFEPPGPADASLFPHQVDIAAWATRGGRRAVFANFGLGKTRIHLQVAKWVVEHTGGRFLIVAPLGVRQEFTLSDGPAMGLAIDYVRDDAEVAAAPSRILITNYERVRDGGIDLDRFAGVGLDEASVLRSFGSKTYQQAIRWGRRVGYRFVFTATPSPNRYKELIHYAHFLGVMDSGEALTRFFQRDSSEAGNLTLYPHMERVFFAWLASWAVFIQRPSDLGYSDDGYVLPGMQVHWHRVEVDHRRAWGQTDGWGQRQLFMDEAQGLSQSAAVKRESVDMRICKAREIMEAGGGRDRHWLVWHDLELERLRIGKAIPEAVTVYGSQDLELREARIMGFSRGEFRVLATKPSIAGSGCNFQRHCADAIFLGVGYKFNDFIQAIHRIYRFQQRRRVNIHIVYLESEDAVVEALRGKWSRHEALMATMSEILRQNRLTNLTIMELSRSLGCERIEVKSGRFTAVRNDCVPELRSMPADSVDFICTSIPFGNQYEYSPSFNDFGHNPDNAGFFKQMEFLCPELLRVLRPGRVAAIHVKDRIRFGNVTGDGFPTLDPFSDDTVVAFRRAGFRLMARITIDTDVVRENNQTYRLGWSENAKDSSKMGAGLPEYVLVFRKLPSDTSDGYADVPVVKDKASYTRADWQIDAAGNWRSSGNRLPDAEVLRGMSHSEVMAVWEAHCLSGIYDHEEHVAVARALEEAGHLPSSFMLFRAISRNRDVWTDISRISTLNTKQGAAGREKHVCPLQLDIIERLIGRYTNRDDVVLDPFMGIGSVGYQALKMGRRALGVELCLDYWKESVGYMEMAEREFDAPTLFDFAIPPPPHTHTHTRQV
ncbi:MAG: DNA methylase N-4 [Deltaproteobacteria bacterium]|jgi:DNA modification methylase|nr:DNA methylase N-4 [Deltaproteobacteria bacterium]